MLILIFDLPHSFNKFDYFRGGLEIGIQSQDLHAPWKSLNFKIKIRGLKSPSKLQLVLESPWISVLTLFNPTNTERPSGWYCSCCLRSKKKPRKLKALFCTEWSPWKMGNVSLKVPEKSLNFLFKKATNPPKCNNKQSTSWEMNRVHWIFYLPHSFNKFAFPQSVWK